MAYAKRVDANQSAVVKALRATGATVEIISSVGDGVPDLIVGFRGFNFLFEVKDGDKPQSKQRLTGAEAEWHRDWRGKVSIVYSPSDAVRKLWNLYTDCLPAGKG